MPLSQAEFEAIIADQSKRIIGDIAWIEAGGHSDAKRFRASVRSDTIRNLVVEGYFRPSKKKLGFALIAGDERIAGVDFGDNVRHRNLSGPQLAGAHLQLWSAAAGRAEAYPLPPNMPDWNQPVAVWAWLCDILGMVHTGRMLPPNG